MKTKMKKSRIKRNLATNVRKLAHKLSLMFLIPKPVRVHPSEYIVNENNGKVYPLETIVDEETEILKQDSEPFFVNNEGDETTTACTSITNSISSNNDLGVDEEDGNSFDPTKFEILSLLGSGTYASVFLAEYGNESTKQEYAIKKFSKRGLDSYTLQSIITEKKILSEFDNPFILRLYGSCQTNDELFLITELIENGDLFTAIYDYDNIPYKCYVFYTACILLGLDHIHSKGIVYRDLKPENIMIDSFGYAKIVDFGMAKYLPYQELGGNDGTKIIKTQSFTICGTPEYFAPEIILNSGYDHSVDLWALGVIIYEMIKKTTPFVSRKNDDLTQLFSNIVLSHNNGLSVSSKIDKLTDGTPNARNLITQLLSGDPKKRLSGEERPKDLLKHPYFVSYSINEPRLYNHKYKPLFLPEKYSGRFVPDYPDKSFEIIPYSGDQTLFASF